MKFIYVASPYTKGDVAENVRASIKAADAIAARGLIPFVPLLYHFWHLISPHKYAFWTKLDLEWLDKCDALVRLPGESAGADAEVARALVIGMPVFYSIEEFLSHDRTK